MITSRRITHVDVFVGSPWEAASIKSRLNAAYIEVNMKDKENYCILLTVPCEHYTAAMRVIEDRNGK